MVIFVDTNYKQGEILSTYKKAEKAVVALEKALRKCDDCNVDVWVTNRGVEWSYRGVIKDFGDLHNHKLEKNIKKLNTHDVINFKVTR